VGCIEYIKNEIQKQLIKLKKMKNILFIGLLVGLSGFNGPQREESRSITDSRYFSVPQNDQAKLDEISARREKIEKAIPTLKKSKVDLTTAREQIKQKWAYMQVSMEGKEIVRIKLYPHAKITERSEEFYYQGGKLILAFINDKGAMADTYDVNKPGKTYWFNDGVFLKESNTVGEEEDASDKAVDGARLLQEGKEYLKIAESKTTG
jgi:hypothetical protein